MKTKSREQQIRSTKKGIKDWLIIPKTARNGGAGCLERFRIEEFPPFRDCMDDRERQGDLIAISEGWVQFASPPRCRSSNVSPRATWRKKADYEESSPRHSLRGGHLFGVIRRSRHLHFRFIWNIHNPFVCLSPGMSASVRGESFETRRVRVCDAGPGLGDMNSEDRPEWYRGPQDQGLW